MEQVVIDNVNANWDIFKGEAETAIAAMRALKCT